MMMDAISAGGRVRGLKVAWSSERDEMMTRQHGDESFQPNESYREIPLSEYGQFDFPLRYDETLIKVMSWGLCQMRRIPHRIVFMLRNPMEILDSMERSFGSVPDIIVDGCKVPASQEPERWKSHYWQQMKQAVQQAELRPDCQSMKVLHYDQVLSDPLRAFKSLAGWPIDAELAAQVVDRNRKRVNHGVSSQH